LRRLDWAWIEKGNILCHRSRAHCLDLRRRRLTGIYTVDGSLGSTPSSVTAWIDAVVGYCLDAVAGSLGSTPSWVTAWIDAVAGSLGSTLIAWDPRRRRLLEAWLFMGATDRDQHSSYQALPRAASVPKEKVLV